MVTLRDYQLEAMTALEQHWNSGGTAALVDMATATGKSLVLAETMRRAIAADPQARLLLAVHVRELVKQDVDALLTSGLRRPSASAATALTAATTTSRSFFGTIQTLFHDAHLLGRRDLLLIDEVQLVPRDGDGMYLSLIDTLRGRSPDSANGRCLGHLLPARLWLSRSRRRRAVRAHGFFLRHQARHRGRLPR